MPDDSSEIKNKIVGRSIINASEGNLSSEFQSSLKGLRWTFGENLQKNNEKVFIKEPKNSINIKYSIESLESMDSFGEIYRIRFHDIVMEERKSQDLSKIRRVSGDLLNLQNDQVYQLI